jgi:hypothetical protein
MEIGDIESEIDVISRRYGLGKTPPLPESAPYTTANAMSFRPSLTSPAPLSQI